MDALDDIRTEQVQLRERQARIEGINEQILARLTSIETRLANIETGQRWLFGLMFTGVLVIAGALITLAMSVSGG